LYRHLSEQRGAKVAYKALNQLRSVCAFARRLGSPVEAIETAKTGANRSFTSEGSPSSVKTSPSRPNSTNAAASAVSAAKASEPANVSAAPSRIAVC
jgi:hypothetical protein